MRQKRKKFSGKQDELSLLEEELAKTKEQLRQKEKELHSLQDLTGYLHPTHNSSRRLSRLPLAVRVVLQVLLSFFKTRAPYEFIYRKGLIVASSTFEKVNRLIEQSLERYPKVDFQILADDRFGEKIAARWPDLQVRIFDRALSRKEKFLLIASLIKEDFDVCLLMFAGDKHYDFLKAAGLLSGSTYIKAYNEFYSSFFVMAKQLGVLQRHLAWRSKQTPVLYQANRNDDKTVIPRKTHRLARLPWAIRVVLQISMPLLRLRFPDEAYYRKGIIIASSTFEKVNLLVEQSIKQYCKVNFLILADDRYGAKIAERWPNLEVRVAHRGIGRREKFALIGSLIKEQYDVCMMLYAGDEQYDFLKLAGLLSGSGYIKEYNEFYTSFFVMAKQSGALLRHLAWRSKQPPVLYQANRNDDKTVIPRKPHRLARLPWAIRVVLQISMPLLRLRFPDEAYYRKGIIIASSTFEKVNLLVEQSIKQYCKVNFLILADDRYGAKIAERWPNLEVRVAHRGIGRREKFALIGSLIKEQYDVCMMLYAGDEQYDFLKLAGLLSGSGYIKEYNEFYTSFFVMAKQLGVLLGHLAWRSKQRSFSVNSNPHLHSFISFYTLVSFQIVRTGIGYLVSFVRIIPMLRTANRLKNAKNPFLGE